MDPKVDALMNDMAATLGRVLSLKHPTLSPNEPLLNVLYREGNHLPDKHRVDKLVEIKRNVEFASAVESLLMDIADQADRAAETSNLLLGTLARRQAVDSNTNVVSLPYYEFRTFTRKQNGKTVSSTRVGGVAQDLVNDLLPIVSAWLHKCDMAMCTQFETDAHPQQQRQDTNTTDDGSRGYEVDKLIEVHAVAISRRIAIPEESQDRGAAELSTVSLEQRIDREVKRAAMAAESRTRDDLYALATLQALCRSEGKTQDAVDILTGKLHHIAYVTGKPLVELGLTGQNAPSMNLEFLAGVCEDGLELPVKLAIAQHWAKEHGPFALNAINQVISRLETWQPEKTGFVEVIAKKPNTQPYVPLMPFVAVQGQRRRQFVPMQRSKKRNGLNYDGRRIVRMHSFVLEMVAHGAFEKGVIEKRIAANVAKKRVKSVSYFRSKLEEQRDKLSIGLRLRGFSDDVVDPSSYIHDEIRCLLCHLSNHSLAEIKRFFNEREHGFVKLRDEFTRRTHSQLTVTLPEKWEFSRFALDGLAIFIPSLERVRNTLTRQPLADFFPNPLGDMVRTIPKVRAWNAQHHGVLRLANKDFNSALPEAQNVLQALSKQNVLVKYYRPYTADGRRFTTFVYEFDSQHLQALVRA